MHGSQGFGYSDVSPAPDGSYMPSSDSPTTAPARSNYMNGPGGGAGMVTKPAAHLDYVPIPEPPPHGGGPMTYPTPSMPGSMTSPPSAEETNHKLGLSIVLVGLGAIVGYQMKGGMGLLAGAAIGGAGANAWKALRHYQEGSEVADKEAKVEATYAAIGTGLGIYLLHRISEKEAKRGHSGYAANEEGEDEEDGEERGSAYDENENPIEEEAPESEPEVVPRGSCPVRRAGP